MFASNASATSTARIQENASSAWLARRCTGLTPAPVAGRGMASESVPPAVWHWLAAALDELDYGIVLLFDGMNVVHINDAARVELDDEHPLQLLGSELRPKLARDVAPLHEAVTSAATRGLRRVRLDAALAGDLAQQARVEHIGRDGHSAHGGNCRAAM